MLQKIEALPALGVGIIYVPGLQTLVDGVSDLLDAVEIEPQTFWRFSAKTKSFEIDESRLEHLAALPGRKILHGVGSPVGGARATDSRQLPPLKKTIDHLAPLWMSEHLAFNRAERDGGLVDAGFLLPPCQTHAGATAAAESIRRFQRELPVPFLVENGVNYLAPQAGELEDGRFLRDVVIASDCGILLDLHNAWCNECNGRQSVLAFLEQIPLERVVEVHLAGGMEHKGFRLDAHSGTVAEPLWPILESLIHRLPNLKALVFEIMPGHWKDDLLPLIRRDLKRMRAIWSTRTKLTGAKEPGGKSPGIRDNDASLPIQWEDTLAGLVSGREVASDLGRRLQGDPGLAILRELVEQFRASTIMGVLPYTARLLLAGLGVGETERLFADFWAANAPQAFGPREADAFAAYLECDPPPLPWLAEILAFDRAMLRLLTDGEPGNVFFRHDPLALLTALAEHRLPAHTSQGHYVARLTLKEVLFETADGMPVG